MSSGQLSSTCCCLVKSPGILGSSTVFQAASPSSPQCGSLRSCHPASPLEERAAVLREGPPRDVKFELVVRERAGKDAAVTSLSKCQGDEAGKPQNGSAPSPAYCGTFVLLPKARGNPEHPGTKGCLSRHTPDSGREYKTFPLSSTLGSR